MQINRRRNAALIGHAMICRRIALGMTDTEELNEMNRMMKDAELVYKQSGVTHMAEIFTIANNNRVGNSNVGPTNESRANPNPRMHQTTHTGNVSMNAVMMQKRMREAFNTRNGDGRFSGDLSQPPGFDIWRSRVITTIGDIAPDERDDKTQIKLLREALKDSTERFFLGIRRMSQTV